MLVAGLALEADCRQSSKCMRRLAKQFELSGQGRDTQIRFGAREVGLICVSSLLKNPRHGESVVILVSVTNWRRLACGAHL